MWFDDDRKKGWRATARKRKNRRRTPMLEVQARSSTKAKINTQRAGVFVLVPAVVIGAVLLLFFGVRGVGRMLFSRNDLFTIRQVEVRAGSEDVRQLTKEYTRIAEGMNIFGFDIHEVRRSVLANTPGFEGLSISRHLPNTVLIQVDERVPLARLGRGSPLVVDHAGCVFAAPGKAAELPALIGYPASDIKPGDRVVGMATAALQVLDVCGDPRLDLSFDSIRVDQQDFLTLYVRRQGERKEVKLSWEGMGQDDNQSRRRLIQRIVRLKRSLESNESVSLSQFDATFPDRIYAQ